MTKSRGHIAALGLLAVTMVATVLFTARGAKPGNWDVEAARRKADFVFLRSQGLFGMDSVDAGMRLLHNAHRLNPTDVDISADLALANLSYDLVDSAGKVQAYQDMLAAFRNNPTDYTTGEMTATVGRQLGRYNDVIDIWTTLDKYYPARTDPAVNLANTYVLRYITNTDTADYNAALQIFNRIERGTGKNLGLSSQKIRAYALRKDTAAIARELRELTDELSGDVRSYMLAGSIYANLQMDSLALANFSHAVQVDTTDGRARVQMAEYYRVHGDSIAYDREVFKALQSPGLDFDTKYELLRGYVSELYTDTLQWPRIEHIFDVLEEVNPGESRVHALYGAFEGVRGDSAAQIEQFSYAMALDPTADNIRSVLVQLYFAADSLDRVIETAEEGTRLFPDNFYYPIMQSASYMLRKDYPQAIRALRDVDVTVVNNKKAVSSLLTQLADAYYQADSVQQAFDNYEQAIRLNPENYLAYNNYAYFLAVSDTLLDKALNYARFAVLNDPENGTSLDTYAWVYFRKKDYANAREQIDAALNSYGYTPPGDSIMSDAERKIQLEQSGISADVLSHAGDIYFMDGDPDEALTFWQLALILAPDDELLKRKVRDKTFYYK